MIRPIFGLLTICLSITWTVLAADPPPKLNNDSPDALKNETALTQAALARQFRDFEQALLRMAQRLEKSSKPEERERAAVLRQAIEVANAQGADNQFGKLVGILATKNVLTVREIEKAIGENDQLLKTLREMMVILMSDDQARKLKEERLTIEQMLKELDNVIRNQKLERAKTESGKGDTKDLENSQKKVTEATGKLDQKMGKATESKDNKGDPKKNDPKQGDPKQGDPKQGEPKQGDPKQGDPKKNDDPKKGEPKSNDPKKDDPKKSDPMKGEPKPGEPKKNDPMKGEPKPGEPQKGDPKQGEPKQGQPGDPDDSEPKLMPPQPNQPPPLPGRKQIQDAQQEQKKAEDALKKGDRKQASDKQDDATKKLEEARKELERRLKQLREEEMERLLANLQQRCERMLAMQIEVYQNTKRADEAIQKNKDRKPERTDEQRALQLADREREIIAEATKTLELLQEEGSGVAFPRFLESARDDMQIVRARLEKVDVGNFTQGVEEDIINTLKEMVAALKKAQQDKKDQPPPPPPPPGGQPPPQSLLDMIAELKMIRSMQLKINDRTLRYAREYPGEQADDPNIQKELRILAQQELKVQAITKDIATGKNR